MKRIMALIIGALLITLWAIPVSAEEGIYETAGDWYRACYDNLPDYICGVWSSNGTSYDLIVGFQDNEAGQIGKEEILGLIRDDTTIQFCKQIYSRSYLLQVRDEIVDTYGGYQGLFCVSINDPYNFVVLEFDEARMDDPITQATADAISDQYGEAVRIEYSPLRGDGLIIGEPYMPLFLKEGVFETAEDWYDEWYYRLPNYVCGCWIEGENLIIGILDNEEGYAGYQEMLYYIEDDSTINIVYQKYSRQYLTQVKEAITPLFFEGYGLQSIGIDQKNNCVNIGFERSYADNEQTQYLIADLQFAYGDAVCIEYEAASGPNSSDDPDPPIVIPPMTQDPPVIDPPITQDPPVIDPPITQDPPNEEVPSFSRPTICVPEQGNQGEVSGTGVTIPLQTDVIAIEPAAGVCTPENHLGNAIVIITFVIVYMISMALMTIGKRKMLVMRQTDFGTTVVESYPISTGSVKKMVKSSHPQISPELDEKVFEAINAANREDMV